MHAAPKAHLTYARINRNLHVRSHKEGGTMPSDMPVQNELDRFRLAQNVIDRLPQLGTQRNQFQKRMQDGLIEQKQYINERGEDLAEIQKWKSERST